MARPLQRQGAGFSLAMTHVDFFSGVGGMSLAAEWAGFVTLSHCEIEPYPRSILKRHWPDIPVHEDIRTFDGTAYQGVDLVTASPPCQPVSCAGKRNGTSDERWLWDDALRVVGECRPRWCLFENPPGILSLDGGHAFERILCRLHSFGYAVWWETIPACAVGAPHKRDRVWIVGVADSGGQIERAGRRGAQPRGVGKADELPDWAGGNILQPWPVTVADSDCDRPQRSGNSDAGKGTGTVSRPLVYPSAANGERETFVRASLLSDGISHQLVRPVPANRAKILKALGNAVVPQVPAVILKALTE